MIIKTDKLHSTRYKVNITSTQTVDMLQAYHREVLGYGT